MNITTIITTILGCAGGILTGILAYIKFFAERSDKKKAENLETILEEKLAPIISNQKGIMEANDKQDKEIKEIRLDTTRTQLLILLQHEPRNYDTIFKIAHRYFCQLGGDWYMSVEFQKWADSQQIKIPESISKAIAENDK